MAVYDGSELVSQNINMCNYNARISVSLKFVAVMDALTKIVMFFCEKNSFWKILFENYEASSDMKIESKNVKCKPSDKITRRW